MTSNRRSLPARLRGVAVLAALGTLAAGCGGIGRMNGPADPGVINVVAAENFWGSLVSQLGGKQVRVLSVVSDPNADPHDYETSASDARAVAEAGYVIQNGVGYDDWLTKLLGASTNFRRRVFNVGNFVGQHQGDNPHLWYNPAYVTAAENHIEGDLKTLDRGDAAYFTARRKTTDAAFAPVRARLADLKQLDAGKPVAATEDIFSYLAGYLGLKLISPPAFMAAVAEGNDPPAASVAQFQQQLSGKQADVLVYNEQTATALTTSMRQLAAREAIPVIGVTETIQPPDATFEQWFGSELSTLQHALNPGGSL